MFQIDHVHFYVEDAQAWRNWFVKYLGFQAVVNQIFPTPLHQGKSFHTDTEVVKSGNVIFLLSSPLSPISPVAEFLRHHPPGVADVAFAVADVEAVTAQTVANGAKILQPVQDGIACKYSKIAAWGRLSHTLIERNIISSQLESVIDDSFTAIDHVVLNVAVGDLKTAVSWYQRILDFQPQQSFKIQTDRSGLHSQVMISSNGRVQLPINEPASPNSQIQEFLEVNRGPGVQHIALRTANLISAIARFRAAGLSFLSVPNSYYTQLEQRLELPLSPLELQAIAQQEILVDCQKDAPLEALLLQIFTQPIFNEPTFFFEFIERRSQAAGFGEGNFRALFAAIESEQIKRGFVR
ncbi:4-hydroxyphenylpyruvate dioxygenase [Anabaena sp. UHCC 0451]|uniref:4-hydroxyphenylpyruvate dioxygenase n=1 Tax=Anabaena sp. UHCC 0451 TaxID=2055235 RepID=UPI002B20D6D8|nr:4-hydroxyphenylpyruvate dioxygenase [Anabaena sp. UHCC 0451]MEA5575373.1 4-hydroxyphenylpyruvate dioxygenase [Anabaena sp. UHCC 0451]